MLYILYFILACFFIIYIRIFWLQRKALKLLRKGNLPLCQLSSVWFYIIEGFLPKYQELDSRIKWFLINMYTCRLYNKERIFAGSVAGHYFVSLYKPEHIEVVLNSNSVINKGWDYKYIKPWLGNGLITSSGKTWRKMRKLLTPAFHFKILENFQVMINKHSTVLIEKLKRKEQEPWLNVSHLMSLCTLDIIAETAMGVEVRAQENEESEYIKAIIRIQEILFGRMMSEWLSPDVIFNISPNGREFYKVLKIIQNFTRQVISEKKKEMQENFEDIQNKENDDDENIYMQSRKKKALLALLLYHHFNNGDISEEDIIDEVNTFMFAGHDTTGLGISWALYNIGLYPDIQQKIRDELQLIFGDDKDRPITKADLREMKYLECVLKETLRLYPSVPNISRTNFEDLKLNEEMTIPKGSSIFIGIYSLHHDPEFYPNAEIFDPERFLPENAKGRHPYAFIPFSAGPRNCIGQKFALMEQKIIISNILRQFWIKSLDPRDKIIEYGDMMLRPGNELRVKFTRTVA